MAVSAQQSSPSFLSAGLLVVALSVLVHLVLLGLLRWPVASQAVPLAVTTLELVAPPPLPVVPSEPSALRATTPGASDPFAAAAPVPAVLRPLELPEGETGPAGASGGGSGIGAVVTEAQTPVIHLASLQVPARRVVFLVDASASMGGAMSETATLGSVAADAVCAALEGLPDGVQFRLMLLTSGLTEPIGSQWNWPQAAGGACRALRLAMQAPAGLTRSGAMFDEGGVHETGAQAIVLVTDGGILDLEAGALQRWLEASPGVRFDVVLIGPVNTPDEAQRRLTSMARRSGGDIHRLFGSMQ